MSSFGAVLDANVLFPASLRDTLLRTADAGMYRLLLTDAILEEVRRNLVKNRMSEASAQRLIDTIKDIYEDALVTGYQDLIDVMHNQEKDRHVLAAAVKSGAQVIVTYNLKDFSSPALAPFDIEAQSPDDFLVHLFHLDKNLIAKILIEQARDLHKPSKTVSEVLDTLARHVPTCIYLVRTLPRFEN